MLTRRNNFNSPLSVFDDFFNDIDTFMMPSVFHPLKEQRSFNNVAQYPVRKSLEDDGKVKVEFDVPGWDKKDLQLNYDDGILSLSSIVEEKDKNYSSKKSINYKISAPDLDVETFSAKCDKGILTVTASPIKEANNKHKIKIY